MALTLVIGNKNYSSWSLRPWIAMKVAGIAFDEVVISLDAPDFKARVSKISGTGKVPALDDNGTHVWESLAILEYLAERFPAAHLWPADPAARAHARAISSEMHAGFRAAAPRLSDEHVAAGQEARTERRSRARMSGASRRCGRTAARAMAAAGRSCSARSAPPTPCMRRWWRAFTPTMSRSMRRRAPIWLRCMALPAWREWETAGAQGALGAGRGRGRLADRS